MRIGIDARMMGKQQASGIGNYIQQIVTRILELDKNNEYYIILKPENFNSILINNPKAHKIKTTCHWYSYCEQIDLVKTLNDLNLDLVHFPQFNVPILYTKKHLTTIHDITQLKFPGPNQKNLIKKLAFKWVFDNAVKNSNKIVTVSEYTKKQINKYFKINPNKIEVTYLGVEDRFKIDKNCDKIKKVKDKYFISKPFLFFVGVWRDHKNVDGLIKAFSILKKEHNLQLVLGGQQDQRFPQAQEVLHQLPSSTRKDILTPGFIPDSDLPYLYQGSEAYIVSSFEEGFGLNGLEAMASQTPVISSQTACLPEIYEDAVLYFDPYNPQDMALKISKVLNNQDLKSSLITKGLKQIKKYSWEKTARQTLSIYQELLKD